MMEGIVRPVISSRTPRVGPLGVMSATRADMPALHSCLGLNETPRKVLYSSDLIIRKDGVFLSGPFIGAPYAVMILETLVAWGAKKIIFLGWCGSISPQVQIGDILIPSLAWIDEGTSRSYVPDSSSCVSASLPLARQIWSAVVKAGLTAHDGAIWTTDAIFRETPDKVNYYRKKGALAVEMELSALFTVATFLNVEMCGIVVVSDDLSDYTWKPGFKNERFIDHRKKMIEIISEVCSPVTADV
jgi:purine-nucleoside phosphorylase